MALRTLCGVCVPAAALHRAPPLRVRPVQRVAPARRAEVAVRRLVVEVMKLWIVLDLSVPWELVTRVVCLGAKARAHDPHVHEKDVRPATSPHERVRIPCYRTHCRDKER